MIEIRKVKASKDDGVEVHYQNGPDAFVLKSLDTPRPELAEALSKLAAYVCRMCRWDELDEVPDIEVRGCLWREDDDGTRKAMVTALVPTGYTQAPLVINTPLCDPDDLMGNADAFARVEHEALLFVQGERAQGDLFRYPEPDATTVTVTAGDKSVTVTGKQFDRAARAIAR